MTRVMMSKPYELMIDLKLFGKLSHFKFPLRERKREATWQLNSKEKKNLFFNCPEINSLFSFPCNAKRLLSFWCFWHFLSNSDILISLSLFKSFFFPLFWLKSVVDASTLFRLHMQRKAGLQAEGHPLEFVDVSWSEGGLEETLKVGRKMRRY